MSPTVVSGEKPGVVIDQQAMTSGPLLLAKRNPIEVVFCDVRGDALKGFSLVAAMPIKSGNFAKFAAKKHSAACEASPNV